MQFRNATLSVLTAMGLVAFLLLLNSISFDGPIAAASPLLQDPNSTPSLGEPIIQNSPVAVLNAHAAGNENMLMASVMLPNGVQQVTLIDTTARSVAVYQIDPTNGQLQLKSVRKVADDFALESFNGTEPSPAKIRAMLEPKR